MLAEGQMGLSGQRNNHVGCNVVCLIFAELYTVYLMGWNVNEPKADL